MFSFKKEKHFPLSPERVAALSAQGLSEREIINTLRNEGYYPEEVDRAMRESLRGRVVPPNPRPPGYPQSPPPPLPYPPEPPRSDQWKQPDFPLGKPKSESLDLPLVSREGFSREREEDWNPPSSRAPEFEPADEFEEEMPSIPALERPPSNLERRRGMEEMVEGVFDEKWEVFEMEIETLKQKYETLEAKVANIDATINQIGGVKRTEVDQIRLIVNSYKENMDEISARMEAIERAVKDSMTPMMQTLRSLSESIKLLKQRSSG